MSRKEKHFPLTEVQWAYILGRKKEFKAGDVATHYYNEIVNEMDVERLEKALNQVIARHPMLHTVVLEDGTQYELEEYDAYTIRQYDLTPYTEEEKTAFLAEQRERLSHYNYQAGTWPMFTFEAAKLDETRRQIFVSIDLAIADAGSILILFNELYAYYSNPELEKEAPPVTFRQFVEYMEAVKKTGRYETDRQYWKNQIPVLAKGPELPRKKKEAEAENKFKRLMHIFEAKDWRKCREVLTKHGMIPTTFLCQCYREVLAYWSGSNQFSINLTTSNRGKLPGTEQVIGDFTSLTILPMPEDCTCNDFWGNAKKLQKKFMEVYGHASYDGISVEREYIKYHNLQNEIPFPVVFTSMMGGEKEEFTKEFFGESVYSLSQTPQVYLDCQVSEEEDVLIVSWDYAGSRFEADMMEQMFAQFVALIQSAGGEEGKTEEILKLSASEEKRIEEYNQTQEEYPRITLQQLVEESFRRYPERIALIDGTEQYTYQEIHKRAEGYAAYLKEQGVRAGDCVGVRGFKTAETIIQILGCVMAGAVFVPIHPEYPKERVDYILKNSQAKLYLDAQVETSQREYEEFEKAALDSPAYIIYTSGSTGVPKGVVISHGSVCNTLYDINRRFEITSEDRIFNISDVGFDLSVYDIFGSMLAGAAMVIGKDIRDIGQICSELVEKRVTLWNSVPAIFGLVLDYMKGQRVESLEKVFLSGDWIPLNTLERMKKIFPNAELISLGGATEGSIWSIYYRVSGLEAEWNRIPYGYPLANQQCYVMDEQRKLCPVGVRGEIYIGGAGVAMGYTEEEQTKKSYFEHEKYGRLYKTGDAGIFEREGYINILGRIDQQVKLHGYRIECMEIEKEIEKNGKISRALVEVAQGKKNRHLLAYIVPDKKEVQESLGMNQWLEAGKRAAEEMPEDFFQAENEETDTLLETTSFENIKRVIQELCHENNITKRVTIEEFCTRCGLKELYRKLMYKWFRALEREGVIQREKDSYDLSHLKAEDLEAIRGRIHDLEQRIHTDYERENLTFFSLCMCNTKQILQGEQAVTELLFPEGDWETAKSLYNTNPRAEFNNNIIAEMIQGFVAERQKKGMVSILEVGAGIGGTSEPVLKKLKKDSNVSYTYTDLSQFFTAQAKQKFKEYPFLKYGIYNLDQEPQCQGYTLESYDIIVAANVMHDAAYVEQSLKNVYHLLKPEGILILLEVTKELYTLMTTVELLEGFSSYEDFRVEKGSPLMCGAEWRELLTNTGFTQVHIFPEEEKQLGENVIVGQKGTVSQFLTTELEELKADLGKTLPPYMIPYRFIQLDHMPMGNNGKINRRGLPQPEEEQFAYQEVKEPETPIQQELHALWTELLGYGEFGIEQEFFEIGGDSLLMIRCIADMEKKLNYRIDSKTFLEHATIEALALQIENGKEETDGTSRNCELLEPHVVRRTV